MTSTPPLSNSKPSTPNPKPGTRNPELETPNPEPQTPTAYTHSPPLHPNLLLGSLQLLFWLLFHPSAWRNHVARIDPRLPADFAFIELNWEQWRHPVLRRLLVMSYVVWPLLVGLIVWLSGVAGASQVFGTPRGVVGGIAFAVAISLTLSVTGGGTMSVAMGIVSGVLGSIAYSLASIWPEGEARIAALVIAVGLALGVAGSVTFGTARAVPGRRIGHKLDYSVRRRVSGVAIGSLIGIGGALLAINIAVNVTSRETFSTLRALASNMVGDWAIILVQGVVFGLAGGIALGIAVGQRISWRYSLLIGMVFGVIFGPARILGLLIVPQLTGAGNAALITILFALSYVLAERIAGSWIGAMAGALGSGVGFFLVVMGNQGHWLILPIGISCVILGLTLSWWRPVVLYPFLTVWNLLLYRLDEQRDNQLLSLLRWHAAFWDEYQRLPFIGLDAHLLLALTHHRAEGQAALDYLTPTPQRWAAQTVQIELDARNLEACPDVIAISQVHHTLAAGDLTGPASALLRSFSRLSQDIESALQQESAYNQRLALSAIEERLDGLLRELTRSSEPYAERFRPITTLWREIVARHIRELADTVEAHQEIDNPYIIGIPLTEQQEIFTGRTNISARIEQLLRDERRPPLFLYGQRRMGKTSLLNNLGRLLPTTIVPLFVDLQGASRASHHTGLLYNIARDMIKSASQRRNLALPALSYETLVDDPFTHFDQWLDKVERILESHEKNTALLALDEFETLDRAITKGRYDEEDVLGMLRHLIQHRPRFKVLLAGSHRLEEFHRWASYLINAQLLHIGYLQEREARQLIERPVRGFALRYEPEASQRVLVVTRGHPFLIQLLCAEIVAFKNEQPPAVRRLASLADVETVVPEALNSGSFFFADIQRNQTDAAGLALLRALASFGEGAIVGRETLFDHPDLSGIPNLDQTLTHLVQCELIESVEGGYRFQVELIRRWFTRD